MLRGKRRKLLKEEAPIEDGGSAEEAQEARLLLKTMWNVIEGRGNALVTYTGGSLVSNTKLEKRQNLLQRALAKMKQMKKGSAFVTDFSACELIQELISEVYDLTCENQALIKEIEKLYKKV